MAPDKGSVNGGCSVALRSEIEGEIAVVAHVIEAGRRIGTIGIELADLVGVIGRHQRPHAAAKPGAKRRRAEPARPITERSKTRCAVTNTQEANSNAANTPVMRESCATMRT